MGTKAKRGGRTTEAQRALDALRESVAALSAQAADGAARAELRTTLEALRAILRDAEEVADAWDALASAKRHPLREVLRANGLR